MFFKLDLADISEIQKIENSLQISSSHLPTPPPPPSSSSFCFLSPKHSNTQSDNTLQPFQTINNNINSVIRQPFSNLTNQSNIQTNFPLDILDDDSDDDDEEYDDDDDDDDENEFNGEDGAPSSSTTTNATIPTSTKTTSPSNSTTTTVDGTTPSSSTTTTGDETAPSSSTTTTVDGTVPSSSTTVDGAAKSNSTSTLLVKDISGTGDTLLRKRFGGKSKPKGTQKVFFECDKTKRTRIKNRRRPTLFKLVSFSF